MPFVDKINILHINIVMIIFVVMIINIIITMKVNKKARYSAFIVYSAYIICTDLIIAGYIVFVWYVAIPVGLLVADLASIWLNKQLKIAAEEEEKGGFGLTKKKRLKQIESYIFKASPADMNRVKKFKENPVNFNKIMFMSLCNAMALCVHIVFISRLIKW